MQKKTKIIVAITVVSLIELLILKPIIPAFFGANLLWQAIYVLLLFGFPVLIAIPIAILASPIALIFKRKKPFKSVWLNYSKNLFLVFGVVILMMNSILTISKLAMGNDAFPLIKYAEVKGYEGDVEDLKQGEFEFESESGDLMRFSEKQVVSYSDGDSAIYALNWISNNEYRLIYQGENLGMNDTVDVKITNNTSEYYECYLRFGEYGDYQKITKK